MGLNIIGGGLIVAGTSIGAAMLAMPIVTARIGFWNGMTTLLVVCFFMAYVAQLVVQIYKHLKTDTTIAKIAGKQLGKIAYTVTSISIFVLLYALITAYLSGLSDILSNHVEQSSIVNKHTIVLCLAIFFTLNLILPDKVLDYSNRFFFISKTLVFVVITIVLLPYFSVDLLTNSHETASHVRDESFHILTILPILVTSFGFHASIPYIYKYLNCDTTSYKSAVKFGSSIVAIIYTIWLSLIIGVIPYEGNNGFLSIWNANNDMGAFVDSLNAITQSKILSNFTTAFVMLAIITSLLGVAAGLFDFILELMKYKKENKKHRLLAAVLTFALPTVLVLTNPSVFISALGLAGVALTIIAIIMPCLVGLKLQRESNDTIFNSKMLYVCLAFGIATILGEFMTFFS